MDRLSASGGAPNLAAAGIGPVLDAVEGVAGSFAGAGARLYLVGGVVRDLLLGVADPVDIDLTTDAEPDVIRQLVEPHASAVWSPGERFGTVAAAVRGHNLEITTHRAESYDPASRKPSVSFGRSLTDDLSRRDFTINAMAISLPDLELIDPFDGRGDLDRRLLRTPRSPATSFDDDPLRMLRAARFLPRFGLEPEAGMVRAATERASRLTIVSVERIHDELERLLAVDDPTRGFDFLRLTGLLPSATGVADLDSTQWARAAALAARPGTVLVRRAGLFLPLGPGAGRVLADLRYARRDQDATVTVIASVEHVLAPTTRPAGVRALVARIGRAAVDDVIALADNVVHVDGRGSTEPFARTLGSLAAREDLSDFGPPLSGREVMDHLDLDAGPLVGRAIDHLRQIRIEHGPLDADGARSALDRWWSARSSTAAASVPDGDCSHGDG